MNKTITLDEESEKLWKKRFGAYSQEFSKYVCDNLKRDALENMSFEEKKEYFEERKIKLKQESELIESEEKDLQSKEKIKQKIEAESDKKKLAKDEEVKKNFFDYVKEEFKVTKERTEKLYEEFKKQGLPIIEFLNQDEK